MAGTNGGRPKQWRRCNECGYIGYTRSPRHGKWSKEHQRSIFCGTMRIVR